MKILFIAPRYTGGIGGHAFRVANKLKEVGLIKTISMGAKIKTPIESPNHQVNQLSKNLFQGAIFARHRLATPTLALTILLKAAENTANTITVNTFSKGFLV